MRIAEFGMKPQIRPFVKNSALRIPKSELKLSSQDGPSSVIPLCIILGVDIHHI
jgi:hypothetical protein